MSAFVVHPVHIDLLISTAIHGPSDPPVPGAIGWQQPYLHELLGQDARLSVDHADQAGAELLRECIASVSFRYPDLCASGLPGQIPTPDPEQYEWTDLGRIATAVEACKAIACYEYQSCVHPGWSASGAASFCADLRANLTAAMSGYDQAPWSWSLDEVLERSPVTPTFAALFSFGQRAR